MNWKFWQKNKQHDDTKLYKPKELPSSIGKHLVVVQGEDPDWIWSLKSVIKEKKAKKGIFDIRIFDPETTKSKDVKVVNYTSLHFHKELILFEGWFDKNSWDLEITDRRKKEKI